MFKWFFNKSLRFQITSIILIILIIPSSSLLYNVLVSMHTEKIIKGEHTDSLRSFTIYVDKAFDADMVNNIHAVKAGSYSSSNLGRDLFKASQLLTGVFDGTRVGFFIPETGNSYIYGNFKQYYHMGSLPNKNIINNTSGLIGDRNFKNDLDNVIKKKTEKAEDFVNNKMNFIRVIHPIIRNNTVVAVVWGETTLHPDILSNNQTKDYAFIITLISLLLALVVIFLIIRNMLTNVNKVLRGLKVMEKDISYQIEPISGELGQVAKSINNMGQSLREKEKLEEQLVRSGKLAALGHLISGVAHEIRNPLGIIRATVQVMEREFKEVEGLEEYIRVVKEQSDRESKVIQELLDYARPSKPMIMPININVLLKSVLSFTKHYMLENHIKTEVSLDENLQEIILDGDKIKQVMINIIINGCEAMEKGGEFTIKTEAEEKWIKISFKDTGAGMKTEELKNIFNPYYTTKPNGTGLGLSISNSIVEMHEGYIDVVSEKGKGSTFIVYLPNKVNEGGDHSEQVTSN